MSEELIPMIWEAFGNDHITTAEAANRLETAFRYKCPDDLAKTLNKLKKEGWIKGKVSFEDGGWIWWVDEECRSKKKV